MGLTGELKTQALFVDKFMRTTWFAGMPALGLAVAIVIDLLVYLRSVQNVVDPMRPFTFTGTQLFMSIMKRWLDLLRGRKCSVVVICIDDPERVPPQKKDEQIRRAKAH